MLTLSVGFLLQKNLVGLWRFKMGVITGMIVGAVVTAAKATVGLLATGLATLGGGIATSLGLGAMGATVIGGVIAGAVIGGVVSAVQGENIFEGVLKGGLIGAAVGGGLGLAAKGLAVGPWEAAAEVGTEVAAGAVTGTKEVATTQTLQEVGAGMGVDIGAPVAEEGAKAGLLLTPEPGYGTMVAQKAGEAVVTKGAAEGGVLVGLKGWAEANPLLASTLLTGAGEAVSTFAEMTMAEKQAMADEMGVSVIELGNLFRMRASIEGKFGEGSVGNFTNQFTDDKFSESYSYEDIRNTLGANLPSAKGEYEHRIAGTTGTGAPAPSMVGQAPVGPQDFQQPTNQYPSMLGGVPS
jgi:hypothetical protein